MSKSIKSFITYFIQAFFISFITALIGIMVIAGMLYKGAISSKMLDEAVAVIYFLSGLNGGFVMGRKIKKRRFMCGLVYGLLFVVIVILASYIIYGDGSANNRYIPLIICAIGGMIGGMLSG